jgi:hypothetical protein
MTAGSGSLFSRCSVDMDESFALEDGHELIPEGMDVKNGMLHVNRQKVSHRRRCALLLSRFTQKIGSWEARL